MFSCVRLNTIPILQLHANVHVLRVSWIRVMCNTYHAFFVFFNQQSMYTYIRSIYLGNSMYYDDDNIVMYAKNFSAVLRRGTSCICVYTRIIRRTCILYSDNLSAIEEDVVRIHNHIIIIPERRIIYVIRVLANFLGSSIMYIELDYVILFSWKKT